jgi:hypothetical protein
LILLAKSFEYTGGKTEEGAMLKPTESQPIPEKTREVAWVLQTEATDNSKQAVGTRTGGEDKPVSGS